MIQVRENVFETNSSSTHSLVFSQKDRETKYPLELDSYHQCYDDVNKGLLCIRFGEFGWGFAILQDPRDKLNYLMTQVASEEIDWEEREKLPWSEIQEKLNRSEKVKHILEIVQSHVPGVKGFKYLRPGEDPDDDEEPRFGYSYPIGYIDHQSYGTANEINPEELIFDPKVIVVIDNDNSCWRDENFKDDEELFEAIGYDFDYNDDRW